VRSAAINGGDDGGGDGGCDISQTTRRGVQSDLIPCNCCCIALSILPHPPRNRSPRSTEIPRETRLSRELHFGSTAAACCRLIIRETPFSNDVTLISRFASLRAARVRGRGERGVTNLPLRYLAA